MKIDDRKKRKINVAELDRIYEKRSATEDQNQTLENVPELSGKTFPEASTAAATKIHYLEKISKNVLPCPLLTAVIALLWHLMSTDAKQKISLTFNFFNNDNTCKTKRND